MAQQVGPQERNLIYGQRLQRAVGDEVVLGVFHQGPQTFGLHYEAEYKCAADSSRTSPDITCQTGGAHISPYTPG